MAKKIFSIVFCVVILSFSCVFPAFASGTLVTYGYTDNKGGFTVFNSEHFTNLSELPYGENSKLIEVRDARAISSSSVSELYCFTNTRTLWAKASQNWGQNQVTIQTNIYEQTNSEEWWHFVGTGFTQTSSGGGLYIDIMSEAPILRWTGVAWEQIGIPYNIALNNADTVGGSKYDLYVMYNYSVVKSNCTYSVMNFTPFNFVNSTFEVQHSSLINAYAYIPTLAEFEKDYTPLLDNIYARLNNVNNNLANIHGAIGIYGDSILSFLSQLKGNTDTIKSDISTIKNFLSNNLYVLLDNWNDVQNQNFEAVISKIDELLQTEPNSGLPADISENREFGNNAFGGDIDTDVPDLSSISGGIETFSYLYDLIDTAFGGMLSTILIILLLIAFIGYMLGRRVNKA